MNMYEVTIERKGRGGHDIPPAVTQLVLANYTNVTDAGVLAFFNGSGTVGAVAAFAPGSWVSVRIAERDVNPEGRAAYLRDERVWS